VHGAGKRKLMKTKNVPPYKHMSEQLEKKLLKVEEQIREAQAMEVKLGRKETVREAQAQREINSVEEDIKKIDVELAQQELDLQKQKEQYKKRDEANVDKFMEVCGQHRQAKTELQDNIETVQSRYHRVWRENYNLKMYHQMDSFWSKKQKEPAFKQIQPAQQQNDDDKYKLAEEGFAAELEEDGAEEDGGFTADPKTIEADPFADDTADPDPFGEEGGTDVLPNTVQTFEQPDEQFEYE